MGLHQKLCSTLSLNWRVKRLPESINLQLLGIFRYNQQRKLMINLSFMHESCLLLLNILKNTMHLSGAKTTMKIPKRATKGIYEHKELIDNDSCYFSPGSLFALPPDSSSLMLDSFQFMDESSDQDLLLNVPSNCSFPEAELLLPASSFHAQASTSSSSVQPQLIRPWRYFFRFI